MQVLWGQPTIAQRLGGLRFDISAASFFQTNTEQAAALTDMVTAAAGGAPRFCCMCVMGATAVHSCWCSGVPRLSLGVQTSDPCLEVENNYHWPFTIGLF